MTNHFFVSINIIMTRISVKHNSAIIESFLNK